MLSSPTDARNATSGVKFGIQSYEIPPAPRPVHGKATSPRYAPGPTRQQTVLSPVPSPTPNLPIEVLFIVSHNLHVTELTFSIDFPLKKLGLMTI
jgi:hypothetical protein